MAQISTPATSSTRFAGFLDRYRRPVAGFAALCLLAGLVLSGQVEPNVRVSTVTLAGCIPALHFAPQSRGPHPIALLAHGYSATKEYLFRYGEALAAAGFECYDVEQPGHGTSPQAYSFMESVRMLETVAQSVGPIDVFLGNSMGGFTGGEAVRRGGLKPKLFIALGSLPKLGDHGAPLVLLAGQFDEIFPPVLLKQRTDARLVLSPWSEHGLEGYDPVLVNAAVDAACAAVGKTPPAAGTSWRWRIAGVALALLGVSGIALCLPQFRRPWTWSRGPLIATAFIATFVYTMRFWTDAMPHPRYFLAQAAAVAVMFLLLLGAGRLRIPRWAVAAIILALGLVALAVAPIRSLAMSQLGLFGLVLCVVLIPSLVVGTLLGWMSALHGSRLDGDLAMAIVVGCALFQWGRPPRTSAEPPPDRVAIKLDAELCNSCAGEYEFPASNVYWAPFKFHVWRQGDHLAGQAWVRDQKGGPVFEYFPESHTSFFNRKDDGLLIFLKNAKGEVTSVIYRSARVPEIEGKKIREL